jgi:hypothetical protein
MRQNPNRTARNAARRAAALSLDVSRNALRSLRPIRLSECAAPNFAHPRIIRRATHSEASHRLYVRDGWKADISA